MLWSVLYGKIIQSTTRFHDSSAHHILHETYFLFHQRITFTRTDHVFSTETNGGDRTIVRFLQRTEFPRWGLFLRLDDRHPITRIAYAPECSPVPSALWSYTGQYGRIDVAGSSLASPGRDLSLQAEGDAEIRLYNLTHGTPLQRR